MRAGAPGRPEPTRLHPVAVARARLWGEALVVLTLCWAYDAVNNLAALRRGRALDHGYSILRFEQRLHLAPELALNGWLAAHHTLGLVLSDYYDLLHFAITLGLLAWLWWRHPGPYRLLRNTLVGINLIGFAVFWLYPLAPPRMLGSAGFVDVVAVRHALGAWSSGALASQANELAAMPSLHMAWAVWCSLAVRSISTRRPVRVAAWAYPVVTALVVIATANHYLLDVVAGVATTVASALLACWLTTRRRGRPAAGRWTLRRRPVVPIGIGVDAGGAPVTVLRRAVAVDEPADAPIPATRLFCLEPDLDRSEG